MGISVFYIFCIIVAVALMRSTRFEMRRSKADVPSQDVVEEEYEEGNEKNVDYSRDEDDEDERSEEDCTTLDEDDKYKR